MEGEIESGGRGRDKWGKEKIEIKVGRGGREGKEGGRGWGKRRG